MSDGIKKILLVSAILICILVIFIVMLISDVDLKIFKVSSVNSLWNKRSEIAKAESDLKSKEEEFNTAVKKTKDAQNTFDSEKAKYESISDDTINVIKEATTEENYDIEYMWIRLGNYAKRNNLTIIMTEPGGSVANVSANKDGSTYTPSTTTSTTTENSTTTSTTATTVENNNETTTDNNSSATKTDNVADTLFGIQVTGSYLNISDFIFDVENDSALRFKLDNISIDYVSGTTIKARFDVKNLIINK